ncbi:hypothetical protein BDN71DRAFT_1509871 [Pleurotus eryngii]|uniref:Uncharacterized protein n=1 Tax=Pleurotus eryngii TaxID=5323 RepID=A0A9P5ZQT2_PLEER|nr:hypothetical protein BDN71DRAFT_1509871 [Pleurotus eryngii]
MVRPRIYYTKAERQAANHAKSNRHYSKNKDEILARRHSSIPQAPDMTPTVKETDVEHHLHNARQIGNKLRYLIKPSLSSFALSVCTQYIETLNTGHDNMNIIESPVSRITQWRNRLIEHADFILQEEGVGEQWHNVNNACEMAGLTIRYLDNILCEAMCGSVKVRSSPP